MDDSFANPPRTMEASRLFSLARGGQLRLKGRWSLAYPYLATVFALAAPFIASFLILIPLLPLTSLAAILSVDLLAALGDPFRSAPAAAFTLTASFAPLFLLIWGWLRLFERRNLATIGLEGEGSPGKYLRGFALGAAMIGVSAGIPAALGFYRLEANGGQPLGLAALGGVALMGAGWLVQGAAEEALARGFLFPLLSVRWGWKAGLIVSSAVFALLHLFNDHLNDIAFLNLALFGVFTALYAQREGSLWGVCALHTAWNWVQGNWLGLEVSGNALYTGALLDLQAVGPDVFTGGAFGPEGGIVVTLVLCLGIITLGAFWKDEKN
jgi:hypothetical protein